MSTPGNPIPVPPPRYALVDANQLFYWPETANISGSIVITGMTAVWESGDYFTPAMAGTTIVVSDHNTYTVTEYSSPTQIQLSPNNHYVGALYTWSGSITNTTSIPFNGYALVQLLLPANSNISWASCSYGNLSPAIQLPLFQRIPIVYGQLNTSLGFWWNTDITPPGSGYVVYYYDATDTLLAGPSETFFVNANTVVNGQTSTGQYGGGATGYYTLPALTLQTPGTQQLPVTPD